MKTYLSTFLLFLISAGTQLQAQDQLKSCGTDSMYLNLIQDEAQFIRIEENLRQATRNMQKRALRTAPKLIPVVFHILKDGEPNVTAIDDRVILAQLDQLNHDFRTSDIQFCLAERVNGQTLTSFNAVVHPGLPVLGTTVSNVTQPSAAHPGIFYIHTAGVPYHPNTTADLLELAALSLLCEDNYIRIFITSDGGWYRGATIYPWTPIDHMIYLDADHVGCKSVCSGACPNCSIYDKGSILAHEVGHYLGLWHTSGDPTQPSCGAPGPCTVTGDQCCDTKERLSGGSMNLPTCTDPNSCTGNPNFPYTNYMDQGADACFNHFTPDQNARMHATLSGIYGNGLYRNLTTDCNLANAGLACGRPGSPTTEDVGPFCAGFDIALFDNLLCPGGIPIYVNSTSNSNSITIQADGTIPAVSALPGEYTATLYRCGSEVTFNFTIEENADFTLPAPTPATQFVYPKQFSWPTVFSQTNLGSVLEFKWDFGTNCATGPDIVNGVIHAGPVPSGTPLIAPGSYFNPVLDGFNYSTSSTICTSPPGSVIPIDVCLELWFDTQHPTYCGYAKQCRTVYWKTQGDESKRGPYDPEPEVAVFPNPTPGEVNLSNAEGFVQNVEVRDVTGRLVREAIGPFPDIIRMNLSDEPNGIYFIHLNTSNGKQVIPISKMQ